jgi:hypothetical protein
MISQCCICNKIEAVKCPRCGMLSPVVLGTTRYLCGNVDCSIIDYHISDGGTSHGYCPFDAQAEMTRYMLPLALALYNHGVSIVVNQ